MSTPTLERALASVHTWLGTWRQDEYQCMYHKPCKLGYADKHTGYRRIPMPPATDELAMMVLRKLKEELVHSHATLTLDSLTPRGDKLRPWAVSIYRNHTLAVPRAFADDPRDAIILAATEWVTSQPIPNVVTRELRR